MRACFLSTSSAPNSCEECRRVVTHVQSLAVRVGRYSRGGKSEEKGREYQHKCREGEKMDTDAQEVESERGREGGREGVIEAGCERGRERERWGVSKRGREGGRGCE